MAIVYNVSGSSGDFTTSAKKNGSAIAMGGATKKINSLSALTTVLADTSTLTLTGSWEVSNDAITWVTAVPSNNAANVVLATGTSGADTAVTRAVSAPDAVYGWRYARFCVSPGVTTALAGDTWAISYSYRRISAGEG